MRHTLRAELPKGLEPLPGGAPGTVQAAQAAALQEGAVWPREHNSNGAGPGTQGTGGHTPGSGTLPTQAEAGKTQYSKDAPATRRPRAVQISTPSPRSIQAPADWELRELLQERTPERESWPPPMLSFLLVSPCT